MDRESAGRSGLFGRLKPSAVRLQLAPLLAIVAVLLPVWLYRHANIQMFKAESGMYQVLAASGRQTIIDVTRDRFQRSAGEHYTPFAFTGVLLASRLFGPRESAWLVIQLSFLALLALSLLALFAHLCRSKYPESPTRWAVSASAAILFLSMPQLADFVFWPFMDLQILFMVCAIASLWFASQFAAALGRGSPRLVWAAVAFAYLSLHFFGTGVAAIAGVSSCLGALWLLGHDPASPFRASRRSIAAALAGLGVATILHGRMMVLGDAGGVAAKSPAVQLPALLARFGGFWVAVVHSMVLNLWAPDGFPFPRQEFVSGDAMYGWATIAVALFLGVHFLLRCRREPSSEQLAQLCCYLFSLAGFLVFTGMIVLRLSRSPQPEDFLNYLIGARYVVLGEFFFIMLLLSLLLALPAQPRGITVSIAIVLTVAALLEQVHYRDYVLPVIWPRTRISSQRVWNLAKAVVDECRARGIAIPNIGLNNITEVEASLRSYEPLLRSEMRIAPAEVLKWQEEKSADRTRIPSLGELERQLNPATAGDDIPLQYLPSVELNSPATPQLIVPITVGGVEKRCIWVNTPGSAVFRGVKLPKKPKLSVSAAIHEAIWKDGGNDGADFQVSVSENGKRAVVMQRYIDPVHVANDRKWIPLLVDLSAYGNRTVDITLEVLPGPHNNNNGDWCLWAEPTILH